MGFCKGHALVTPPNLSRRDFLQLSAGSMGTLTLGSAAGAERRAGQSVSIVTDPADAVAAAPPVIRAVHELETALAQHGIALRAFQSVGQAPRADVCIVAAASNAPMASETLDRAAVRISRAPESQALVPAVFEGRRGVLACGSDARGLMYALLELADQVRHAEDPLRALQPQMPVAEEPFNRIRSIGRLFVSDVEDKPWFNDREFWPPYLSMLASQRFNRLQLSFGIGYDSLQTVTDAYLLFAYPFLLPVPGYAVRAVNLPDAERDRNLEMLRFISSQAVAHGIDFQLGIWTHGYRWADSPRANYVIEGLTPDNHSAYCRDALGALLQACPAISGVTLRTHGESGVREGSYSFWKTVFAGAAQAGRQVELDLHTKGLDDRMIGDALATGMPVRLSPKYWAEHLGMPYHQAAIRELEMPREHADPEQFSALSTGSRSFTRYGYADFLREDRPYSVMYRVWPGTHRFLLSGDPVTAAANARAFGFCGSQGAEYFEPLSFKGRRGSGLAGGRCAYADTSLNPRWDWEKYRYTYRLWGRLLYNPDAEPQVWRRYLHKQFQRRAPAVEAAIASATRILPIVTTAHLPSAANDTYYPEFYTNQPIADPNARHPYGDTPSPKVCGNVSPLDPQMFVSCRDFIDELLEGPRSGRYSPIDVAHWLEGLADTAARQLALATSHASAESDADLRRIATDVRIQIGLGRFFAAKLRSATLYSLHARSADRGVLERALTEYRRARGIWTQFAEEARTIYVPDVTVGPLPHQRGHWLDRLPAIDADIATMARQLEDGQRDGRKSQVYAAALREIVGGSRRAACECAHVPPAHFIANQPLPLALSLKEGTPGLAVRLHYRHVNQAEDYEMTDCEQHDGGYRAAIPSAYTASNYPLQYFFELRGDGAGARLYPGFAADRVGVPYFVVRSVRSEGHARS